MSVALRICAAAMALFGLGGMVVAQTTPPPLADMTLDLGQRGRADPDARRIAVTLTRGVRSGRDLSSHALRATRARMVKGQTVGTDALRALADAGDGVAALRLIKRLDAEGRDPAPRNVAHYYGVAASTGRVVGLHGLVRTLKRVDPGATGAARLTRFKNIVMAYARAGNSVAIAAMMEFHDTGRPFGPLPDEIAKLAASGRGGAEVIALQLAGEMIQTGWDDAEVLGEARGLLQAARESNSIRVKLIAGNFLPVLETRIAELDPVSAVVPLAGTEQEQGE